MRKEVIYEGINNNGQQIKVVAIWVNGRFLYTKTYIFDDEGYVDSSVTVFSDGAVATN